MRIVGGRSTTILYSKVVRIEIAEIVGGEGRADIKGKKRSVNKAKKPIPSSMKAYNLMIGVSLLLSEIRINFPAIKLPIAKPPKKIAKTLETAYGVLPNIRAIFLVQMIS